VYHIRILDAAAKELAQLDKSVAQRIARRINWLAENLEILPHEALTGTLTG